MNLNSQLNKFGAHNGGPQDEGLLNEKWESLGLVPVDGLIGDDDEWFVLAISDNDFITQTGFMNGGAFPYSDASGYEVSFGLLVPDSFSLIPWWMLTFLDCSLITRLLFSRSSCQITRDLSIGIIRYDLKREEGRDLQLKRHIRSKPYSTPSTNMISRQSWSILVKLKTLTLHSFLSVNLFIQNCKRIEIAEYSESEV